MTDEVAGGRIFFSSTGRTLDVEDEICLLSVGVDIGSSTSHLVFSRIVLERLDSRYVVTRAGDLLRVRHPAHALCGRRRDRRRRRSARSSRRPYADAKVDPDEIDTGALILTGVAVRRRNARAIGELFAGEAGKLVAVSAGDSLETVMAAYGSGAVARSIRDDATVMNVDIGGGTSKIAVCARRQGGRRHGARRRRAPAGHRRRRPHRAHRGGRAPIRRRARPPARARAWCSSRRACSAAGDAHGGSPVRGDRGRLAAGGAAAPAAACAAAAAASSPDMLTFSGGVSEYIYGGRREIVRRPRPHAGA